MWPAVDNPSPVKGWSVSVNYLGSLLFMLQCKTTCFLWKQRSSGRFPTASVRNLLGVLVANRPCHRWMASVITRHQRKLLAPFSDFEKLQRVFGVSRYSMESGPVYLTIKQKLEEELKPSVLQVVNESYKHAVPRGSETHFKVSFRT